MKNNITQIVDDALNASASQDIELFFDRGTLTYGNANTDWAAMPGYVFVRTIRQGENLYSVYCSLRSKLHGYGITLPR